MKTFILRSLFFITPFVVWFLVLEFFVLTKQNALQLKAEFLKENLKNVETLILGSSHNQWSINPRYLHSISANVAFGGQDLQLDSAIFFSYIDELSALRNIILEVDYHTLEHRNENDYYRLPLYLRYFDVELYPIDYKKKISLYYSSPSFFNMIFFDHFFSSEQRYSFNEQGFVENEFKGAFYELNYDSIAALSSVKDRAWWNNQSLQNYSFNVRKINSIIDYCRKRKLRLIVISTPAFASYWTTHVHEKEHRRRNYIDSLLNSGVEYHDFERDVRFKMRDFQDDDHLNSEGARKFSVIVDQILSRQ